MARRKRRSFSPSQKADAIRLVRQVGSVRQVARDLDLHESSLRLWMRDAEKVEGGGSPRAVAAADEAEIRRLRREVETLKKERDFLKKAAAFFAKEQDRRSS